jgi:hypothetical protein
MVGCSSCTDNTRGCGLGCVCVFQGCLGDAVVRGGGCGTCGCGKGRPALWRGCEGKELGWLAWCYPRDKGRRHTSSWIHKLRAQCRPYSMC